MCLKDAEARRLPKPDVMPREGVSVSVVAGVSLMRCHFWDLIGNVDMKV